MTGETLQVVEQAKQAALEVLLHNAHGPYRALPRVAGWGYPEPYTRDLMISSLGVLVCGDARLVRSLRRVLRTLAANQTPRGHIPSLVHDPTDCGASDTTPLFLFGLGLFRQATGEQDFLQEAADKALRWMEYQSPEDIVMVAQQPTTDWRDEQWVPGYGLYVNTIVYACLRLFGRDEEAKVLRRLINRRGLRERKGGRRIHEGLAIPRKPYYALWALKVDRDERFDLLGNSLAILTGIASAARAKAVVGWIEAQCRALRARGELALSLPPCLFPYIEPSSMDWRPRYALFNQPGDYHNGGVWPFICAFYVAALVAAGHRRLAEQKLVALTELVRPACKAQVAYGFNEWFKAQTGVAGGQDWQTWSAAMYLYAAAAVQQGRTPFFDDLRNLDRLRSSTGSPPPPGKRLA